MAAFEDERRERFAQGLACGVTASRAWEDAGYKRKGCRARACAAREDMKARVAELTRAREWGGSNDLAPVIDACMRLALAAGELETAAGMVAARGLLAEAARLKAALPVSGTPPSAPDERPELTDDEWLARYAPTATGA